MSQGRDEGGGEASPFRYFLTGSRGRPPRWISAVQWTVTGIWAGFTLWLVPGPGLGLLEGAFSTIHGAYSTEAAVRYGALPAWSLTTLALGALVAVLQALWRRCEVAILPEGESGLSWPKGRGPSSVVWAVRTEGGWWIGDGERSRFVPRGYVNAEGREWKPPPAPTRGFWALRLASPSLAVLFVLVAGAYGLSRPYARYWHLRVEAYRTFASGNPEAEMAFTTRHPEFRPWMRYLSTLRACREAACLRRQIRDRLELLCTGPFYGADGAVVTRLLILNGRSDLALRLSGENPVQGFQIAVRLGRVAEARRIVEAHPGRNFARNAGLWALWLLETGRYEEAHALAAAERDISSRRPVALLAVTSHLTGRCVQRDGLTLLLLSPHSLKEARLDGEAPATGLGALQRAAREISHGASVALGFALLGDGGEARAAWRRAEDLAEAAGLPGYLDVDRVLLGLVDPEVAAPVQVRRERRMSE
ncbi:MAG: hypothetical protein ACOYXN_04765 [Acidobacteriota bacterium]